MASKISNLKEEDGKTTFTISNVDVSYVNAIRRTILSDIPIVVFKTTPYEENKANIITNTSRLNNEIVKQRLSCIPICIKNLEEFLINNYLLELDVENKTDTSIIVTTKDFKIKDISKNKYLEDNDVKQIFPPYIPPSGNGEYYIDFLRLRPKLTDEIPGEKIKLTSEFSIGTSREDSMFNVTGTCSYGFTPNPEKIEEKLEKRKQKWKDEGMSEKQINFEAANWKLLEGMRYVVKNSFDFIIESVGIYDNEDIIIKACIILYQKLAEIKQSIQENQLEIIPSDNTLENSYDVILVNEDYTIGNILNSELYKIFYTDLKIINYVGFKKIHPHDTDSILRISLINKSQGISSIEAMLISVIEEAIKTIKGVKGCFDGTRKVC